MNKNIVTFVIFVNFVVFALFADSGYALNLDKLKINFLQGNYKLAIQQGERILAGAGHSRDLDELYYILGLSYMKDGNYLRAADIFEIVLKEFKDSEFKEEARLGLGDTYFLREDYTSAESCYKELIANNPSSKLKSQLYCRLSQVGFKKGDTQQGREYAEKLKREFPSSIEFFQNKDAMFITGFPRDFCYTVQVGSFAKNTNARNLMQELIQKGYDAYIEETVSRQGERMYRVRVGKSKSRQEALILESKLSRQGYPTRIYP